MLTAAPGAAAQDLSVWLDAAASQAQPPADTLGDAAGYGLLGARIVADFDAFSLQAGGRSGRALEDAAAGRWLQGELLASSGLQAGPAAVRVTAGAFGLDYLDPFSYRAGGVDLRSEIAMPGPGRTVWVLAPRLTEGRWSTETLEGDLRIGGAGVELQGPVGPWDAGIGVELLDAANGVVAGTFVRGRAGTSLTRGRWTVAGELSGQRTPLESELGGTVSLLGALSQGVAVRVEFARGLRDPLFGTPGSAGITAGISVRPVRWRPPAAAPVVAVGAPAAQGREVRFTIRAPEAEQVALSGDFTGWDPVPMERRGQRWTVVLALAPGVHHFGFLVDGDWAVPPEAPGLVDDGWGRLNASVVIEP